ncbi:MAG: S-layer homology domain-containing protein [Gudongella sp.]|nr:S-layer homology domain-containing protein [Gudongella sp.]
MKKTYKISLIVGIILVMILAFNINVLAEGESGSILSSAYGSTYVVKNDGSLWGWGLQYTGNGNENGEPQITPIKILNSVRSVSANIFGGVAVKKDDTLWGWGSFDGYLNNQQDPKFLRPVQIFDDVKIAANGNNYILAVKNDNSLWISGGIFVGNGTDTKADTSVGFVKVMDQVKSVTAGRGVVFVIKEDNTLWAWGDNSDAQLGNMTDSGDTSTNAELSATKILDDVALVREGGGRVLAVRLDGSLYSWGSSKIYTENGWVDNPGSPYKVMDGVTTATMCQNGSGVLVVKTDGTLWGWDGQWNDEGNIQEPYKYSDNVTYVSNGERHAAVVKKDGTLWTMGGNYRNGLGYNSDEIWYTPLTKVISNVQDSPASWAMEEVEKAIGMQLVPENMQGNYTKAITREEFCILAIKMIEVKSNMSIEDYISIRGLEMTSSPFVDTNNKDVIAASVLEIVNGTSPTTFEPNNPLTREAAAKVLSATARAVGKDITANAPNYADIEKIANWAKPYTGYVYNINVMKGVGSNRFDPRGGYQRQQAYMTMYRLFKAIDSVSMEEANRENTPAQEAGVSLLDIKTDISLAKAPNEFYMSIEGTTKTKENIMPLEYDVFYKNADVRIDTSWDNMPVSTAIYNSKSDATYVETKRYTHFAEYTNGNLLPIRLLNVKYLEQLELDSEIELFTANYDMLDGEKVLYIKTSIRNGVITEMWYSMKYLVPIKFREIDLVEGFKEEVNWNVVEIDDSKLSDDGIFDIPDDAVANNGNASDYYDGYDLGFVGTTRDLLLYEVSYIDTEDKGFDDMTQIFYYSDASYEVLVAYFKSILEGTEEYSVFVGDEMTSIDGMLNGDNVIVIVNNYKKYEPQVGKNGVNINYY